MDPYIHKWTRIKCGNLQIHPLYIPIFYRAPPLTLVIQCEKYEAPHPPQKNLAFWNFQYYLVKTTKHAFQCLGHVSKIISKNTPRNFLGYYFWRAPRVLEYPLDFTPRSLLLLRSKTCKNPSSLYAS